MVTVLAKPAHEFVIFGEDHCVFVVALDGFRRHSVVIWQLVLLGTCAFALFAADTLSSIVKYGLAHYDLRTANGWHMHVSRIKFIWRGSTADLCGDGVDNL
jgi:hypothetical protein